MTQRRKRKSSSRANNDVPTPFGVPQIDIPKFDMPKFELPRFDLPKYDIPRIKLPKVSQYELPQYGGDRNINDEVPERVPIPQRTQKQLLIRSGGVCERCGESLEGLNPDFHHKNGDPSDNRKSNLIVLCPNCHRRAHSK